MEIIAHVKDSVTFDVECENGVSKELSDFFAFRPDGYQWNPAYKHGAWDGYVRLFQDRKRTLYRGLRESLVTFARERNYELRFTGERELGEFTTEDAQEFAASLNIHSGGKPITPHDYQIEAFRRAIEERRILLISPTASGKSLIIYLIVRYLLHVGLIDKLLLTVPTINLVKQMVSDFADYSSENGWSVEKHIHPVTGGVAKNSPKPIVVSTWQSIYKQPKSWFLQFHAFIGDEAHTNKAKSLVAMMEAMTEAEFRIGTTGTLDGSAVNRIVLEGLIGPVYKVISTKELMEQGKVAQLTIMMLQFEYTDPDRALVSKMDYQQELSFLIEHPARTRALTNLAASLSGNSIVLFQRKAHGTKLFASIRETTKASEIPLYYSDGGTDPNERERMRGIINKLKRSISTFSLGTFSTGVNIKNLHFAIFAHPFKSVVLNLQSIGRILRKDDEGKGAVLYDIVDDLTFKGKPNYAVEHAKERMLAYKKEGFKIKWLKVPIPQS